MRRRSRSERRRACRRAVLRASERGPVLRPRAQRTSPRSRLPGRLWRRQVQSHPLMHAFVLVFINTTHWPVLQNCICFACWKHGWIATPWFVITIPWPPRLMSKCVWTLIDIGMLRALLIIWFIWQRKCVWEGIKCGFSKDEYGRDGRHFCVICRLVCLSLCGRARRETSILSCLRTELVCHLT